jgi:hypothetical protein
MLCWEFDVGRVYDVLQHSLDDLRQLVRAARDLL